MLLAETYGSPAGPDFHSLGGEVGSSSRQQVCNLLSTGLAMRGQVPNLDSRWQLEARRST